MRTENQLLAEMAERLQGLPRQQDPARRHLSNPRIQNLLDSIKDTNAVDVVIHIIEDMERTNTKLLQKAATYEELITCREFAKVCGLLVKKLKRGNQIKKKQNEEDLERSDNFLKGG